MKALFAMDLINGCAVRLQKGDFSKKTIYSSDPPEKIAEMIDRGAKDFHIIDLDGARYGVPHHAEIISKIRRKVSGYMEVGGGIRTRSVIDDYQKLGIDGIIAGTAAFEDNTFFHGLSAYTNIVLGLDLYEGRPMVHGWKSASDKNIEEVLEASEHTGIMAILCTSIARDGMLSGPDYEAISTILTMTRIPLIASGGVTSIDDVKRLKDMGVWATILGKAIYENTISIEEAMRYAD